MAVLVDTYLPQFMVVNTIVTVAQRGPGPRADVEVALGVQRHVQIFGWIRDANLLLLRVIELCLVASFVTGLSTLMVLFRLG